MGALLVFIFIVAMVMVAIKQHKESKRRKILALENIVIGRGTDIIRQSIDIANSSKNYSTKKSRIDVAIKTAQDLVLDYPHRQDCRMLLDDLEKVRVEIYTNCVKEKIIKYTDKSNTSTNAATKINYATKALAEIEEGLRDHYVDNGAMESIKKQLENYIHQVQGNDLKQKAERLEFKGNHAKAADAYMDVLFFLQHDNIDDKLQADEITTLQEKVEALQNIVKSKSPKKTSAKPLVQ